MTWPPGRSVSRIPEAADWVAGDCWPHAEATTRHATRTASKRSATRMLTLHGPAPFRLPASASGPGGARGLCDSRVHADRAARPTGPIVSRAAPRWLPGLGAGAVAGTVGSVRESVSTSSTAPSLARCIATRVASQTSRRDVFAENVSAVLEDRLPGVGQRGGAGG